jgi:hypothetical protein
MSIKSSGGRMKDEKKSCWRISNIKPSFVSMAITIKW